MKLPSFGSLFKLGTAGIAVAGPFVWSRWQAPSTSSLPAEPAAAYVADVDGHLAPREPLRVAPPLLPKSPHEAVTEVEPAPVPLELESVIRFDLSPQQIIDRWPRVSVTFGESAWQGYRIPLVTGTREHDLAGSLTYYFDSQQVMQRLAFVGYTRRADLLAAYIEKHYRLRREPSSVSILYLSRWNGAPTSALRVQLRPVQVPDLPAQQEVMLELNRPSLSYGLSVAFRTALANDLQRQ